METSGQPAVCRWEYKFITKQTESYLLTEINELGREGWELVSTVYAKDLKGVWCWTGWLKRPWGSHSAAHAPAASALMPEATTAGEAGQPSEASPPEHLRGFDLSDGDFGFREEAP